MPRDARDAWIDLNSVARRIDGLGAVRSMLKRLAHRQAMKDAWAELKYFKNTSPRRLIYTTFLSWSSALRSRGGGDNIKPQAMQELHELAKSARTVSDRMRAFDHRTDEGITDATLMELDRVAAFLEREARFVDNLYYFAPLPRKILAHNAHEVAFVNQMCDSLWQANGRRPYSLVAILTNVTFDVLDKDWNANRVRKCYNSRSKEIVLRNIRRFLGQ